MINLPVFIKSRPSNTHVNILLFMNSFEQYTDDLRKQIGENRLENVIEKMLDLLEPLENDLYKRLLLIQSSNESLKKNEMIGRLNYAEAKDERRHICGSLIIFVDDLECDRHVEDFFAENAKRFAKTREIGKLIATIYSDDPRVNPSTYEVSNDLVIGRHITCNIILDDDYISRKHTSITVVNNALYVRDLDSRNGTYINNAKILEPKKIDRNCSLRLYDYWFAIRLIK